ncbi:unnamed protein product [Acanthoscelides obtectus]|uniref:MADF domain-containing protein n=1 Tax=Acanthoscelides obtectus TaxID=200917 RepID=A0A9P0P2C3_ACAOB|nr:unnamed protein product [Acanthoscelides obtectus]CAK1632583.1 hypothetical protein AOBTE_LOCUS7631 [Acanthoscelides obtectus]
MSDDETTCVEPSEGTASSLTTEQQHLKSFILNLESLPEIWDSSRNDYLNKLKRTHAYEKLVLIYKKIKPNAAVDDVRKK